MQIERQSSRRKRREKRSRDENGKGRTPLEAMCVVASICILNAEFRLNLGGDWSKRMGHRRINLAQ